MLLKTKTNRVYHDSGSYTIPPLLVPLIPCPVLSEPEQDQENLSSIKTIDSKTIDSEITTIEQSDDLSHRSNLSSSSVSSGVSLNSTAENTEAESHGQESIRKRRPGLSI